MYVAIGIAGIIAVAAAPSDAAERQDTARDAARIYSDACVFCHDADVGPVLAGRGLHPSYVRFVVRNGLNAMPAFRTAEINDREIAALADYVAALPPQPGEMAVAP